MNKLTKSLYPPNWKEIANNAKRKVKFYCQGCGQHDSLPGNCLTVHHLDYNPANCDPPNLIVLCAKCHLRLQHGIRSFYLAVAAGQLPLFDSTHYRKEDAPCQHTE